MHPTNGKTISKSTDESRITGLVFAGSIYPLFLAEWRKDSVGNQQVAL